MTDTVENVREAIRIELSKWTEPQMVEDEPDIVSEFEERRERSNPLRL